MHERNASKCQGQQTQSRLIQFIQGPPVRQTGKSAVSPNTPFQENLTLAYSGRNPSRPPPFCESPGLLLPQSLQSQLLSRSFLIRPEGFFLSHTLI